MVSSLLARVLVSDSEGVFEFSASAISKWRQCPTSYGFSYVRGIKTPAGGGAALGSQIHSELERWLLTKTPPELKFARSLTALGPHPDHPGIRVEEPLRILFPVGAARGFMDVFLPTPAPAHLPKDWKWSPDIPAVMDWKSTASIENYALDEDSLVGNVQAVLYGIAARIHVARERKVKVTDVQHVDLGWNYSQTKGRRQEKAVRVRQSLAMVDDHLPAILTDAEAMRDAIFHGPDRIHELAANFDSCSAFGGCPYRDQCPAYQTRPVSNPIDSLMEGLADPVPASSIGYERKATDMASSDILARLKAKKAAPMTAEPAAASAPPPALEPAPVVVAPKAVTPEPELQPFDASGTLVPGPPVKLNPQDAVPNLTPETAPKTARVSRPKSASEPALNLEVFSSEALLKEVLNRQLAREQFASVADIANVLNNLGAQ